MGHKKADERETVIKWLKYCDKNQFKPWLWDFKNCYTDSLPEDSITAFFKYKKGESKDTTRFCITGKRVAVLTATRRLLGCIKYWAGKIRLQM